MAISWKSYYYFLNFSDHRSSLFMWCCCLATPQLYLEAPEETRGVNALTLWDSLLAASPLSLHRDACKSTTVAIDNVLGLNAPLQSFLSVLVESKYSADTPKRLIIGVYCYKNIYRKLFLLYKVSKTFNCVSFD